MWYSRCPCTYFCWLRLQQKRTAFSFSLATFPFMSARASLDAGQRSIEHLSEFCLPVRTMNQTCGKRSLSTAS